MKILISKKNLIEKESIHFTLPFEKKMILINYSVNITVINVSLQMFISVILDPLCKEVLIKKLSHFDSGEK